jgi:hypothetical protein
VFGKKRDSEDEVEDGDNDKNTDKEAAPTTEDSTNQEPK